ncbi:hypothetical protein Scep_007831 [Stephania cephalantha]|uniref:FAR1 domain-containing protein n=1 Tax=Stephania cephalantha TaxID=152367 RepID=A0AAP0KCJ5_9MAGN
MDRALRGSSMGEEFFGMSPEQERKTRDIFGSSDIEGSSHESLGCEDNSVPLVDEVSISNVIHEQDFNIVSHPIPTVGMSFGSVDELLGTYQVHAKEKGFAVVIRSSTKDEDGQLTYVWLSCDRGRNTYFEKHSKRVNCPAKVRAIRGGDNRWLVSKVVVEHNHELIPDLSFFMRGHRELNARNADSERMREQASGLVRASECFKFRKGGQRT